MEYRAIENRPEDLCQNEVENAVVAGLLNRQPPEGAVVPAGREMGMVLPFGKISGRGNVAPKGSFGNRFGGMVGRHALMIDLFEQIDELAPYDFPVNLFGETGTGKELVARAIHTTGCRSKGAFVPVNCGALPENLVESELFGHVRGAFSGAVKNRKGRFELASGGTIFLDEIADLSPAVQVKLLRVLQEGMIDKVGAEQAVPVDVRVICATNKDLKREMKRGRFREDLYYRLNVVPMALPPLRKRKSDIPLLVDHFLDLASKRAQRSKPEVDSRTLDLLKQHGWPGNIRELQSAVHYAIMRSRGKCITPDHLPPELKAAHLPDNHRGRPFLKLDEAAVRAALIKSGGNRQKASRILGVGRATLYRFFEKFPHLLEEEL